MRLGWSFGWQNNTKKFASFKNSYLNKIQNNIAQWNYVLKKEYRWLMENIMKENTVYILILNKDVLIITLTFGALVMK